MAQVRVEIPTITIAAKDGENLIDLIKKNGVLPMKFTMPIPQSDKVKIQIFAKINDLKMFHFVHSIKEYIYQFEDKIDLEVIPFAVGGT